MRSFVAILTMGFLMGEACAATGRLVDGDPSLRAEIDRLGAIHLQDGETFNEAMDYALAELSPATPSTARRNLQDMALDSLLPVDTTPNSTYTDAWDAELPSLVIDPAAGFAGGTCNDPLASNVGQQARCAYDCAALKATYFTAAYAKDAAKTRCFVYDPATNQWPSELMSRKQTSQEWNAYLEPSAAGTGSFDIRGDMFKVAGRNVDNSSCTDIKIKIVTTAVGGEVTWTLDGGPSTVSFSTATSGVFEHTACVWDNDANAQYNLAHSGAGSSSWTGTASVHRTDVYDETIRIPTDENWIVQGASEDGIPVQLNARFASGTPLDLSNSSIVIRHVRFTGLQGTPDPHWQDPLLRKYSQRGRTGGALEYEGGFGSLIEFDHCVWDHNGNNYVAGPAFHIAGRAEDSLDANTRASTGVKVHGRDLRGWEADGAGITLNVLSSLFWANSGFITVRTINIQPLTATFTNNSFLDNDAVVGHVGFLSWYATMTNKTGHSEMLLDGMNVTMTDRCQQQLWGNPWTGGPYCYAGFINLGLYGFNGQTANTNAPPSIGMHIKDYTMSGVKMWYLSGPMVEYAQSDVVHSSLVGAHVHDTIYYNLHNWQNAWGYNMANQPAGSNIHITNTLWEDNAPGAVEEDFVTGMVTDGGALKFSFSGAVLLEHSSFHRNIGGNGGGGIGFIGSGSLTLKSVLFKDNWGYLQGGGVNFKGLGGLSMVNVIFDHNYIKSPPGSTVAVFVRVYTGGMGVFTDENPCQNDCFFQFPDGTAVGEMSPVWKIDGLPPMTGCNLPPQNTASKYNNAGIEIESPPGSGVYSCLWSSPSHLQYKQDPCYDPPVQKVNGDSSCIDGSHPAWRAGNETVYGSSLHESTPLLEQGTYYSTVLELTPGPHVLWHGAILNGGSLYAGWTGGAWIDIDNIIDRKSPTLVDNRNVADDEGYVRYPSCTAGMPHNPVFAMCPAGEMFWSSTDFTVGWGDGGGLYTQGTFPVDLNNVTFVANEASNGASMSIVGATSVTIKNSAFVESPGGVSQTIATTIEPRSCSPTSFICPVGKRCANADNSISCIPCLRNEIGNGLECTVCPAGMQPDANQTACILCPVGSAADFGICNPCSDTEFAPTPGTKICLPCPPQTRRDNDGGSCVCDTGVYNGTAQLNVCFNNGYDEDQLSVAVARHLEKTGNCDTCPTDATGEECLVCTDGDVKIRAGFIVPALAAVATDNTRYVFRCHHDLEIAQQRCPGETPIDDTAEGSRRLQLEDVRCATGYKGQLCGECAPNFGMSSDRTCVPCEDTNAAKAMLIFFALIFAIAAVLTAVGKLWASFPLRHLLRCSIQPGRILITYSQVTSQLGDVLDFQYPGVFGDVIEFLKPVMDVFGLLFRGMGPSECFGIQGFTSRWLLRVVGLPTILSFFVILIFFYERFYKRKIDDAVINAKGNFFFVVFFCYPTICIVTFAAFICKQMTPVDSVLEMDDAVMCEDPSHRVIQYLSVGVIVLVAVGLPVILLLHLIRKTIRYDAEFKGKNREIAKRMSVELDVSVQAAEFVIRDVMIGRDLSFVMDAFEPRFLYWEAVDMFRKLSLVGLVLVVGRGTIAQLSTAITIAFLFFSMHVRTWPYKVNEDNMFRAATELHVFIAILVALVLKNNLSWEVLGVETYDWILFISFLVLVPGAFFICVVSKVRYVNTRVKAMEGVDARERRRRAFDLQVLGLGEDSDKADLQRYIKGWHIDGKYAAFLSHFKMEAAAEARILKLELQRGLRIPSEQVFLDADNLTDLRELLEDVRASDVFILMLTDGVLSRPWCLAELDAAVKAQKPIIVLQINNSFACSAEKITKVLSDLPTYLKQKNPAAIEQLKPLLLNPAHLGPAILQAIPPSSLSSRLSFDPNQSNVMLRSQIHQLATQMVSTACPQNEQLLSFLDLSKVEPDPWSFNRKYAVYMIFAEGGASKIVDCAEKLRQWLSGRGTGISSEKIVFHTEFDEKGDNSCVDGKRQHPIDESLAIDCNVVMREADTVLLLQTKQCIEEPRCLARLYQASKVGVPIVPVYITSKSPEHSTIMYDFETAKLFLENLEQNLDAPHRASVEAATGAEMKAVGRELARTIPNIIAKPLSLNPSESEFEAQMLDIELTLRRVLTQGVPEILTPSSTTTSSDLRTQSSTDQGQNSRPNEGTSPREGTPPRDAAQTPEP